MSDLDFLQELQTTFLVEAMELLETNETCFLSLESRPSDRDNLEKILRLAHNLKGSSKSVGFDELADFCHKLENLLVAIKNEKIKPDPIIIDLLLKCNDRLKEQIGILQQNTKAGLNFNDLEEMLLITLNEGGVGPVNGESKKTSEKEQEADIQSIFDMVLPSSIEQFQREQLGKEIKQISETEGTNDKDKKAGGSSIATGAGSNDFVRISLDKIDNLLNYFGEQVILQSSLEYYKNDIVLYKEPIYKTVGQLSKITYDLQQTAISLRMFGLKNLFAKMERVVRDTAKNLNKKVNFIKIGEENELDKNILDAIVDPLTHMIRNAVDHGLESSRDRLKKGKNEEGTVTLNSYMKGGQFYIEVTDDGAGLNTERILQKAKVIGLVRDDQTLDHQQICELIFHNGLSTKDQATDISGRGVGMDVVRDAIVKLKGSCDIKSTLDVGTTFLIRLPLTLAIFKGLVCRLGDERFVFANSDIEETATVAVRDIRRASDNNRLVELKGEVVPIIDLEKCLHLKPKVGVGLLDDKEEEKCTVLVVKNRNHRYALAVRELISLQRIVQKNLGNEVKGMPGVAGGTILGDGKVSLILEVGYFVDDYLKAA